MSFFGEDLSRILAFGRTFISITYTESINHHHQIHLILLCPSHHLCISLYIIINSVIFLTRLWPTYQMLQNMSIISFQSSYFSSDATSAETPSSEDKANTPEDVKTSKLKSIFIDVWPWHIKHCVMLWDWVFRVQQQSHTLQQPMSVKRVISPDHNSGATLRGN